jgi:uncharacterized protein (TIGR00255 family)
MTAFARSQQADANGELIWELRSLNHRYLDLSIRLPDVLRQAEPAFRQQLNNSLARGKVEATLKFRANGGEQARPTLNAELAAHLNKQLGELERIGGGLSGWNVDAVQLLQWPGLLQEQPTDFEALAGQAGDLLNQALDSLVAVRRGEGAQLAKLIGQRLDSLAAIVIDLEEKLPAISEAQTQRMRERFAEIIDQVEPQRLEQEAAMLLQKMDVAEELDRLNTHIRETRQVLTREEPVGRRLDFLMQEFHREANTLGSKSVHEATTAAAIDMKVLIEQMREQVQNIE